MRLLIPPLLCFTSAVFAAEAGTPFASPTELTATLADPINIDLRWKDNANNEAGYFVEYSPDNNHEWAIIEALPPNATSYRHPHLIPHTLFVFRVRPFFGLPSNAVEIVTGKEGPQESLEPYNDRKPTPLPASEKRSLKAVETAAAAAPTDFKVTLIPPAALHMQWSDRAADAEGYLLEIKNEQDDFRPSAFLEAGTNHLVTHGFPFETRLWLRVRAIVSGEPSNKAEQKTGAEPGNDAFPGPAPDSAKPAVSASAK